MKSLTIILLLLLSWAGLPCKAIEEKSTQNYHFVYIDHEAKTPTTQLCKKLKELYDDACETGDVLIIYLSTGMPSEGYCMLSLTNLTDISGKEQDTEEAFDKIIGALQSADYHAVSPKADVQNILKLFDDYKYQGEKGELYYKKVELTFYVGSRFWALGYNYSVLSYLYALLDVPNMPKENFDFSIMGSNKDKPDYADGIPFGDLNLQGINKNINIKLY